MALQNPKYQRASFDFVSPLITINQQKNAEARQRTQDLMTGVKDLATGAANAANWYQRERKVEYIGDEALNKLKKELETAKTELTSVRNQMRVIKAEDIGSLDTLANTPTLHNAEQDVNAYDVDGGRFASNRIDPYDSGSSYEAIKDDFIHPNARRGSTSPEVKSKYKLGLKAFGGV